MKTNITLLVLHCWNSCIKNFLIAVVLGLLGGAMLSAMDHAALNDCVQETLSSDRYLP